MVLNGAAEHEDLTLMPIDGFDTYCESESDYDELSNDVGLSNFVGQSSLPVFIFSDDDDVDEDDDFDDEDDFDDDEDESFDDDEIEEDEDDDDFDDDDDEDDDDDYDEDDEDWSDFDE